MRPSQRQVRAFASSRLQPKAGDQFVNRQQNRRDKHPQTCPNHLSDGLRAGAGRRGFPTLSQGMGGLTLVLERPVPPSGQPFCSFPHPNSTNRFWDYCLPSFLARLWPHPPLSDVDPAISFAEASSQTFNGSPCLQGPAWTLNLAFSISII